MDALIFIIALLFWVGPLALFPLSTRCPPRHVERWLGVLVVSSWLGLAVYVWMYYWIPERDERRMRGRRVAHT